MSDKLAFLQRIQARFTEGNRLHAILTWSPERLASLEDYFKYFPLQNVFVEDASTAMELAKLVEEIPGLSLSSSDEEYMEIKNMLPYPPDEKMELCKRVNKFKSPFLR